MAKFEKRLKLKLDSAYKNLGNSNPKKKFGEGENIVKVKKVEIRKTIKSNSPIKKKNELNNKEHPTSKKKSPKKLSFVESPISKSKPNEKALNIEFKTGQVISPPKSDKKKFLLFEHSSKLLNESIDKDNISPLRSTAEFGSFGDKKSPPKSKQKIKRKIPKNRNQTKSPMRKRDNPSYGEIHLNLSPPQRKNSKRKESDGKKGEAPPKDVMDKIYKKMIKKGLKKYKTPERIDSKVKNNFVPSGERLRLKKNRKAREEEERIKKLLELEEQEKEADLMAALIYKEKMDNNVVELFTNDPGRTDKNFRGEGIRMDKFDWNLENEVKKLAMIKRLMKSREPPRFKKKI